MRSTKEAKLSSNEGFYELPDSARDDASFFAELLDEPDFYRPLPDSATAVVC